MIAQRKGVANCMTTLKLREDNTFMERNVCFSLSETTGNYRINNDTIFFENISLGRNESKYYEFAVIKEPEFKNKNGYGDVVRYRNYSDTIGVPLWIVKSSISFEKNKNVK